jgi:hypothetical protein
VCFGEKNDNDSKIQQSRIFSTKMRFLFGFIGAFVARGIVAEPPSASEAKREGDGADSPTRAHEVREAARPKTSLRSVLIKN